MRFYSTHAIDQLTRHVMKDTSGFNWLMNNGYKELLITFDAIRDDKKAIKFLMDVKAFEWAACVNIINGDDKAEEFLKKSGREHFVLLAHAIQMRIHEDGDRNVSPWGVLKNLMNFKKEVE